MIATKSTHAMPIQTPAEEFGTKNSNQTKMSLNEYKDLYNRILRMSYDAETFGLFNNISEEEIEKAKIIRVMIDTMLDVPQRRMEHILAYKKVKYDYYEHLEELHTKL